MKTIWSKVNSKTFKLNHRSNWSAARNAIYLKKNRRISPIVAIPLFQKKNSFGIFTAM